MFRRLINLFFKNISSIDSLKLIKNIIQGVGIFLIRKKQKAKFITILYFFISKLFFLKKKKCILLFYKNTKFFIFKIIIINCFMTKYD